MQASSCCISHLTLHKPSSNDSFADAFRQAMQKFRKAAMLLLYILQKKYYLNERHIYCSQIHYNASFQNPKVNGVNVSLISQFRASSLVFIMDEIKIIGNVRVT